MTDILQRLTTKEPEVLWALVALVVGYAIWGFMAGRPDGRKSGPRG